jgi:predicted Rossmann fold nucleotide-binding protein DprA/Smf involved in DNA uptake
MKQLQKELKAVSKSLKQLQRKTEQMAKRLDKLDKAGPAKNPRAQEATKAKAPKTAPRKSVAKKAAKPTAIATITDIITKAKKGVDTATLEKQTGLKTKQIWNVINSLKKQGKVKSAEKGVYVRV